MTVQDRVEQGTGWSGLLEVAPLPALHVAAGEMVTAVNSAWETLSGLDEHASVGTGWTEVVVDPDRLRVELAAALVSGTSGSSDHQLWLDGAASWCRWWWRPAGDEGLVVGVASIEADKTREHQLWYRATHDPLTELTNRAEFVTVVERAIHRGRRTDRPPAVIYIDLDGFKAVNDDGGHHLGDQVLRSVARRLSDAVRPTDVAARVGGDEFAVVCEDLPDSAAARQLAKRIRSAVGLPISVGVSTVDMSATTGIAFAGANDDTESLLSRADLEMYAAKYRQASDAVTNAPRAGMTTSPAPAAPEDEDRSARSAALDQEDALVGWLINRIFTITLDLHVTATTSDAHTCGLVDGVVENLDRLIVDLRLAIFDQRYGDQIRQRSR
jgi:diguanylate cyclase (GGDEF)-like protein